MEYILPFVVGCGFVMILYLLKGQGENENENNPPYFVIFCIGLVLAFGGMFFFGNSEETVNNMMKEIDFGEPKF